MSAFSKDEIEDDIKELKSVLLSSNRLRTKKLFELELTRCETLLECISLLDADSTRLGSAGGPQQALPAQKSSVTSADVSPTLPPSSVQKSSSNKSCAATNAPTPDTSQLTTNTKQNVNKVVGRTETIRNYGWHQTDKLVKLYVRVDGLSKQDCGKVSCTFTGNTCNLSVQSVNNVSYSLLINNLTLPIVPNKSSYETRKDEVLVLLHKAHPEVVWPAVTAVEAAHKKQLDGPMSVLNSFCTKNPDRTTNITTAKQENLSQEAKQKIQDHKKHREEIHKDLEEFMFQKNSETSSLNNTKKHNSTTTTTTNKRKENQGELFHKVKNLIDESCSKSLYTSKDNNKLNEVPKKNITPNKIKNKKSFTAKSRIESAESNNTIKPNASPDYGEPFYVRTNGVNYLATNHEMAAHAITLLADPTKPTPDQAFIMMNEHNAKSDLAISMWMGMLTRLAPLPTHVCLRMFDTFYLRVADSATVTDARLVGCGLLPYMQPKEKRVIEIFGHINDKLIGMLPIDWKKGLVVSNRAEYDAVQRLPDQYFTLDLSFARQLDVEGFGVLKPWADRVYLHFYGLRDTDQEWLMIVLHAVTNRRQCSVVLPCSELTVSGCRVLARRLASVNLKKLYIESAHVTPSDMPPLDAMFTKSKCKVYWTMEHIYNWYDGEEV